MAYSEDACKAAAQAATPVALSLGGGGRPFVSANYGPSYRTNRGGPRGGFIPAETLVLNGTAGDNGTAHGPLNQPVLGLLVE